LTVVSIVLAFVAGACFLVLAARSRPPAGGVTRRARLLAGGLRVLYLVAGLLLVVRGSVALAAG
jgi:hypothetical protein